MHALRLKKYNVILGQKIELAPKIKVGKVQMQKKISKSSKFKCKNNAFRQKCKLGKFKFNELNQKKTWTFSNKVELF